MKFEVVNDRGVTVMTTSYAECVPDEKLLSIMAKSGHKFRLDGKAASIKKITEAVLRSEGLC